jgi:hypothetical protein
VNLGLWLSVLVSYNPRRGCRSHCFPSCNSMTSSQTSSSSSFAHAGCFSPPSPLLSTTSSCYTPLSFTRPFSHVPLPRALIISPLFSIPPLPSSQCPPPIFPSFCAVNSPSRSFTPVHSHTVGSFVMYAQVIGSFDVDTQDACSHLN